MGHFFAGRSELHRSPQITTDTTDHTDPKHRSHRSLGNGTDPSKFFKYGSKSIKYGLGLPDNHSEVPMASKLVVVPILTPLAFYIYIYMVQNGLNGLQMVQFECPKHWNPPVSSNSGVGWIPLSHYWPSGVIRNGSPVWSWKRRKYFWTKWASWTSNGPVWMPQALKSTCLIQFWSWVNSTFHYWPSGVIRNGSPV